MPYVSCQANFELHLINIDELDLTGKAKKGHLIFTAGFEGGNLGKVNLHVKFTHALKVLTQKYFYFSI